MSTLTLWTDQLSQTEDVAHLVLHLHWRPSSISDAEPHFLLWAESGNAPQSKKVRGRLPARPQPKPHPFVLKDISALRNLLQAYDARLISQGSEQATLYLPSSRTGPIPSPDLIHSWEIDRKSHYLAPWEVTGLRLPIATALDLLAKMDTCQYPEHVVQGSSLHYWHKALNLVLETLTQQCYIPSMQPSYSSIDSYGSVWRPVLETGDIRSSLLTVSDAMPPLCRSELTADDEEPSALLLLERFIQTIGDHLVRTWGVGAPHRVGYLHNHNTVAAWLKSLLVFPTDINGRAGQLQILSDEMQSWQRNLAPAGNTSFTIALRLVPPPTSSNNGNLHVPERGWCLKYLLQARDDLSILVPAEEVWLAQQDALIYKKRRFNRPQEKLLKSLGQAANVFPPIERSLQAPTPTQVELSTTEVYSFLREGVPVLEQSGFRLILPDWWEKAEARLGLKLYLSPNQPNPPDVVWNPDSADQPISYRWELVLGETTLTQQAFADLVALRSPLVQKGGRWLRLDPEQIDAARKFWKRHSFEGRMDLQQAMRVTLGLDDKVDIAGLPVYKVIVDGWLPEIIDQLSHTEEAFCSASQPDTLSGELRPYQCAGYTWLHSHRHLGLGALLADDMGLGKSIQAIAMLLHEQQELGGLPEPTLLICPTSLLGNWRREFERFGPGLRVFIHYGSDRPRAQAFARTVSNHDVVLTSYTLARRDAEWVHNQQWYGLILDEAQKIKNPDTQVAQAVYTIPSQFRMVLTGTPVENKLTELWSLFHFLNKGYLGSLSSFRKQFAYPIERSQDPITTARLQRLVRPFILRRLKSDPTVIQDLPERQDMKVYCTLSEEQVVLYETVVDEGLPRVADSRGRARRIHVFNLLTRLKQILNHPAQYHHTIDGNKLPLELLERRSGKLDRLIAMLEEMLDIGDKALVFTQFAEMGHLLSSHIQEQLDRPVLYLYGGVPAKKRQELIARFQDDPQGPPIFVLTLKTGGLGLNLTAANHVFHYDRWWNPAVENQASDRAYRIGQTRNVQIYKFITAGTLEEAIDDMIERKQGLAEAIIGSDEGWIAEMSTDDLADLVTLRTDRI